MGTDLRFVRVEVLLWWLSVCMALASIMYAAFKKDFRRLHHLLYSGHVIQESVETGSSAGIGTK